MNHHIIDRALSFAMYNQRVRKPLIFVDASYLIFYTYYTVFYEYKFMIDSGETNLETLLCDESFQQHFYSKLSSNITKLARSFKTPYQNIVISKDCRRQLVWRKRHFDNYKENRSKCTKTFNVSIFGHTYRHALPRLVKDFGVRVVQCDTAEADDIVAVLHRYVRKFDKDRMIIIVTNDNDYLQLADSNTCVLNLKYKDLRDRISPYIPTDQPFDAKKYLRYKIIIGDMSDNIQPVVRDIDTNDAWKMVTDNKYFKDTMSDPCVYERYKNNRLLIDFGMIPTEIRDNIIQNFKLAKDDANILPRKNQKMYENHPEHQRHSRHVEDQKHPRHLENQRHSTDQTYSAHQGCRTESYTGIWNTKYVSKSCQGSSSDLRWGHKVHVCV